jgi:hypothetical protein
MIRIRDPRGATALIRLKSPQWTVFNCDSRFRILVAGRRFGKTYLALVELFRSARAPAGWSGIEADQLASIFELILAGLA